MNRTVLIRGCLALMLVTTVWAAPLEIKQDRLGNVFVDGEPISLQIDTEGDSVTWSVVDSWGREMLKGTQAVSSTPFRLVIPLVEKGCFSLTVEAMRAGNSLGERETRLAILSSFDPVTVTESPFGVMTHFAQGWNTDLIPLLARAGIKHVRDEVYWDAVEKKRGEFAFDAKFENYMHELYRYQISPLTPLSFGNALYDQTKGVPAWAAAPFTEDGFNGYSRYAQAVLKHYGRQIRAVEIWNEYNGGFAKGPADSKPEVYAAMIKHAYPAIKQMRPDVKVLGCGAIGIPLGWIEDVFKAGGLDAMDGVSIHPYGYLSPPEVHDTNLSALSALIRKYNHGRDKPIWVTEQGYYTTLKGENGGEPLTELVQARYLVRVFTIFLAHGVERSFWYLARDFDPFGTMGLLGKPNDPLGYYAPKPAYVTYAVMIRQLTGLKFAAREATEDAVRSYRFEGAGRMVRVMWATTPREVALEARGPMKVTDMMGVSTEIHPVNGLVCLKLSECPVYVEGAEVRVGTRSPFAAGINHESARGEPLTATFTLPPGLLTPVTIRMAGQTYAAGKRLELNPPNKEGEMMIPFEVMSGDDVVYAGALQTFVRQPFSWERNPRLTSLETLELSLVNRSTSRKFQTESVTWVVNGQENRKVCGIDVAPLGDAAISLSVTGLVPHVIYPVAVSVTMNGGQVLTNSGTVSFNPVPVRTIAVDGDLTDWVGVDAVSLDSVPYKTLEAPCKGSNDLGGVFMVCRDPEFLYLAAAIRDDVQCQDHTGFTTWRGDNIQIGFSPSAPWATGVEKTERQELGLSLTSKGPEFYRYSGPLNGQAVEGVQLKIRRDETAKTTIYECGIPWTALSPQGPIQEGFSLAIYVNDNDGAGRKGYKQWGDIKSLDGQQWFSFGSAASPE